MTAAKQAKEIGLKNLIQVMEITGKKRRTLDGWCKNQPKLFVVVLVGCKTISLLEETKGTKFRG